MAALHSDECFPFAVVEELRRRGHDVLTARDAGRAGQGIVGADVLAYATTCGRAVLTHNHRDYARLHWRGRAHAGIISCTRDADSAALAARIDAAIAGLPHLATQFVRVVRPAPP